MSKLPPVLNEFEISEAKDWLCQFERAHPPVIYRMSDDEIINAIERLWDGGIKSFKSTFDKQESTNE